MLRLLLTARLCASLVPPPSHRVEPCAIAARHARWRGGSPIRAKRRLLDDDDAKEEAVDPVQWGQAGAALLANEWSNVAEQIGIDELGDLVEARPSDIHGTGLFATRDLEMGTLVTLYRPDLTVDDTGKALMIDEADAVYFQDFQKAQAPGSRQYFVFPPGVKTSAIPDRCPRFWVAANPAKEAVPGFLGHLANDGASCADDGDVERYLAESAEKANACLVPLCIPLMGLVLAADVKSGDELLVTYGYDAWLRTPLETTHSKAVEDLLRKGATQYAGLTLMASERYGDALKRLSNFVRTGSTEEKAPPKRAKRKKKPTSGGFG
jgi:hypothetical protein